jgi:DNA-binding response OmpR family regulator
VNVLLVEDETTLADVLARNLRAHGHDVHCVSTARDAVASIAANRPDAVVLDVNLPDETGWQVLRNIDAGDLQRMHVVVISAAPISPRRIEEFKPARSLLKPFPIDALARAIENTDLVEVPGE